MDTEFSKEYTYHLDDNLYEKKPSEIVKELQDKNQHIHNITTDALIDSLCENYHIDIKSYMKKIISQTDDKIKTCVHTFSLHHSHFKLKNKCNKCDFISKCETCYNIAYLRYRFDVLYPDEKKYDELKCFDIICKECKNHVIRQIMCDRCKTADCFCNCVCGCSCK